MLVTVCILNHNYGRFLAAAIESVLEQTHSDVDLLVVDDGSTDESREVIAGYGDRVRAHLQERVGQAAAAWSGVVRSVSSPRGGIWESAYLEPEPCRLLALS